MKCEPLKEKKQKMMNDLLKSADKKIDDKSEYYFGFKKGVDDSFDVFASSVDLYNKYKNNVKLLMNEQKEVWLKFVKYYDSQSDKSKSNYLSKYNNWLFNYIFHNINNLSENDLFSL